jgi:Tfp pilus assembly protein PilO
MPRSFKLPSMPHGKNPRVAARAGLAVLLLANAAAFALVLKPWASSASELEQQEAALRRQMAQKQASIRRLQGLVSKVEAARGDGDRFMDQYLMSERTVSSTLLADLVEMSRKAGIHQREASFSFEPIEGSQELQKATVTATYEGAYADLIRFLNLLDRSPRFLIVESLGAAPQQSGTALGVTLKLDAFVREGGAPPTAEQLQAGEAAAEQAAPAQPAASPAPPQAARPVIPQRPAPAAAPEQQLAPAFMPPRAAPQPSPRSLRRRGMVPGGRSEE